MTSFTLRGQCLDVVFVIDERAGCCHVVRCGDIYECEKMSFRAAATMAWGMWASGYSMEEESDGAYRRLGVLSKVKEQPCRGLLEATFIEEVLS